MDHGGHFFARLELEDVVQVGALGRAAGFGNLIALLLVDPAGAGEEEDVVVAGGGEEGVDIVLLPQALGGNALAAPLLGAVGRDGHALDVPGGSEGKDAGLLLDEVLDVDLVRHVLDLGQAVVAVLIPNFQQFFFHLAQQQLPVGEQLLEPGDLFLQLVVLVLQLFPVQTLEGDEPHIADGLGLDLVQVEAVHQVFSGVVIAGPDDPDHFVDVVLGDEQTLQQMGPFLGLALVEQGPAGDDLLLEGQILVQNVPQGQDSRLPLVVHQGQHVDGEGGL